MNVFDQAAKEDEPWIRAVGAVVAAVIALVIAVLGAWLVRDGWMLGVAGLPGTTVLASMLAPRAVTGERRHAVRTAGRLALYAILLADGLASRFIVAWAAVTTLANGDGPSDVFGIAIGVIGAAAYFVGVFAIGAVFFGLAASVVVLPAALIWVALVRRLARPIA